MKKYFFGIFLAAQSFLAALYMGNPAEAEMIYEGFFSSKESSFGIKVGYQGDWVFNRLLRGYSGSHRRVDHFKMVMNQGVLILNYIDRFELYGTVGSMRNHFWLRPGVDNIRRKFKTDTHWTAGAGARLLLGQWGCTGLGLDGKIQYGRPRIKKVSMHGDSFSSHAHLAYHEWQISIAVYHTFRLFTPYLGFKYSNVHANANGFSKRVFNHKHVKMKNRFPYGLALGCGVSPGKKFDVNLEIQLVDEQGLSVGGNIRF